MKGVTAVFLFETELGRFPIEQWFLILGLQMFLDCRSQKPSPLAVLARISENLRPRTFEESKLRTTAVGDWSCEREDPSILSQIQT